MAYTNEEIMLSKELIGFLMPHKKDAFYLREDKDDENIHIWGVRSDDFLLQIKRVWDKKKDKIIESIDYDLPFFLPSISDVSDRLMKKMITHLICFIDRAAEENRR